MRTGRTATKTVLVVDADVAMDRVIEILLRAEGLNVATARTREEALHASSEATLALALVDIESGGSEHLDIIREIRECADLRVIAMSDGRRQALRALSEELADGHLCKPFSASELVGIVCTNI